ncbi:MAG: FtsW/RodA/SpoVE family cell cycle protein, partial [Pseudomonadota bacterium]
FAEKILKPDMPGNIISAGLLIGCVSLLVLQPDFGQTILLCVVWAMMLFVTGVSWIWIFGLIAVGAGGLLTAYLTVPHVASRIDRYLNPDGGDTYQVDMAKDAFERGGVMGTGPGGGSVKQIIPDAHSDFTFAVAGEEFGAIACIVLLGIFCYVVVRGLNKAMKEDDPFRRIAVTGLVSLFGLQAVINMGVNVALLPAKGMTLPFISYGGSSLLSMAFAMGLVLSLTRRRAAGKVLDDLPARPIAQPQMAGS